MSLESSLKISGNEVPAATESLFNNQQNKSSIIDELDAYTDSAINNNSIALFLCVPCNSEFPPPAHFCPACGNKLIPCITPTQVNGTPIGSLTNNSFPNSTSSTNTIVQPLPVSSANYSKPVPDSILSFDPSVSPRTSPSSSTSSNPSNPSPLDGSNYSMMNRVSPSTSVSSQVNVNDRISFNIPSYHSYLLSDFNLSGSSQPKFVFHCVTVVNGETYRSYRSWKHFVTFDQEWSKIYSNLHEKYGLKKVAKTFSVAALLKSKEQRTYERRYVLQVYIRRLLEISSMLPYLSQILEFPLSEIQHKKPLDSIHTTVHGVNTVSMNTNTMNMSSLSRQSSMNNITGAPSSSSSKGNDDAATAAALKMKREFETKNRELIAKLLPQGNLLNLPFLTLQGVVDISLAPASPLVVKPFNSNFENVFNIAEIEDNYLNYTSWLKANPVPNHSHTLISSFKVSPSNSRPTSRPNTPPPLSPSNSFTNTTSSPLLGTSKATPPFQSLTINSSSGYVGVGSFDRLSIDDGNNNNSMPPALPPLRANRTTSPVSTISNNPIDASLVNSYELTSKAPSPPLISTITAPPPRKQKSAQNLSPQSNSPPGTPLVQDKSRGLISTTNQDIISTGTLQMNLYEKKPLPPRKGMGMIMSSNQSNNEPHNGGEPLQRSLSATNLTKTSYDIGDTSQPNDPSMVQSLPNISSVQVNKSDEQQQPQPQPQPSLHLAMRKKPPPPPPNANANANVNPNNPNVNNSFTPVPSLSSSLPQEQSEPHENCFSFPDENKTNPTCVDCDPVQAATLVCVACSLHFCASCFEKAHSVKRMRDHQFILLNN